MVQHGFQLRHGEVHRDDDGQQQQTLDDERHQAQTFTHRLCNTNVQNYITKMRCDVTIQLETYVVLAVVTRGVSNAEDEVGPHGVKDRLLLLQRQRTSQNAPMTYGVELSRVYCQGRGGVLPAQGQQEQTGQG